MVENGTTPSEEPTPSFVPNDLRNTLSQHGMNPSEKQIRSSFLYYIDRRPQSNDSEREREPKL
jgi:hypothetical protein